MAPPLRFTWSWLRPELPDGLDGDPRERLVDLYQVDVSELKPPVACQGVSDGGSRLGQEGRVRTSDGPEAPISASHLRLRRSASARLITTTAQAPSDSLAGGAGGDGAVLGEDGAEAGETLRR